MNSDVVQMFGLLAILASGALVFARVVGWVFRRRPNKVRLGIELFGFFAITYFFCESTYALFGFENLTADTKEAIAFLWALSAAFTIDAGLKRFVWDGVLAKDDSHHVPKLLRDFTTVILYAAAVMVVMHFVYDEPVTAVLATSGAAAVIVGFSVQSTLSEVFAGLSLNAAKSLRVGDFLEIDGIYGRVHEINWRCISLINPHTDSLYVFPNTVVAKSIVLNYSAPTERFKNTFKFVVEYSAPPELVMRIVLESLKYSQIVFRDPAPDIHVLGFTGKGMEYRIRYFFDGDEPWWDAQNEVASAIWSSLRRNGIPLAIERFYLQSGHELEANPWPKRAGAGARELVSLLSENPLFSSLPETDVEALAATGKEVSFSPPECIYFEGDAAESFFVVANGSLTANRIDGDNADIKVGTFSTGSVFGIFEAVSGGHRGQMVQATQFSILYEIPYSALNGPIDGNAGFKTGIDEAATRAAASHAENAEHHAAEVERREHRRQKRHLMRSLRRHVSRSFNNGFFAKLLGTVLPRSREKQAMEAIMAACAVVAFADGEVDSTVRRQVEEALHSLDMIEHLNAHNGMVIFDSTIASLKTDADRGRRVAMASIEVMKSRSDVAIVIVGIGHSIAAAGEVVSAKRQSEVERIASVLNVSHQAKEIIAAAG
jgi:small-conductance mechanosensitive channel/tellurite resistance protein